MNELNIQMIWGKLTHSLP